MSSKVYLCACGKKFEDPRSFNGHKSHCKAVLGEEKWRERNYNQMHKMRKIGKTRQTQAKNERKELELRKWVSEKHTCEKCGKIMTEKYGSGRFCCRACANSREVSEEKKEKIRESYFKTMENKKDPHEHVLHNQLLSGYYHGIYCASGYELIFALYCENHGIQYERCEIRFSYKFNGQRRLYVPDFYLPESNMVVELKGTGKYYNKELVAAKQKAAENSKYNYKLIMDKEFFDVYFKWAQNFYGIKVSDYAKFCRLMYSENPKKQLLKHTHDPRTAGYKWMNNGNTHTLVKQEDIESYLAQGWKFGRICTETMKSTWIKLRKPRQIKPRINANSFRKGKKQMHKGEERIFVLPEDISKYLAQGWKLGTGHKQKSPHHSGGAHHFKK